MASFNLDKGAKFNFCKSINNFRIALGWDASANGNSIDVDASAFGCISNGGKPKFYNDGSHAVCYANTTLKQPNRSFKTADGSITHTGDNRTGEGDGDDEVIFVDVSKLPEEIDEILIFVTIYESGKRGQSFNNINNAYIRILNEETGDELCRYDLSNEFSSASVQAGSLVKNDGVWSFHATGAEFNQELGDIIGILS